MAERFSEPDLRLLDDWQRGLPLVAQPFAAMAAVLGMDENEVIARLMALREAGAIARVGGTLRPQTAGASTLAALRVPGARLDEVAAIVGDEPGVNHSYLREHEWNLWFVATGPDAAHLDATLARIGQHTGLRVLNLPLVRAYTLDLGFSLSGARRAPGLCAAPDVAVLTEADRPLLQWMTKGLPLVPRPFATVAQSLGRDEDEVIARYAVLEAAGILQRIGVIVRHRALGWTANAMVVWQLPDERIDAAGAALAAHPGVTLCYRRRTVPGLWPYALFSMIHGRSRAEALGILARAARLPELEGARNRVLFSLRCFKQTGALVDAGGAPGVAAE